MSLGSLTLLFLLSHFSLASTPGPALVTLPFFRAPTSNFPSGQLPISELERSYKRAELDHSLKLATPKGPRWVQGDGVLRDTDTALKFDAEGRPATTDLGLAFNLLPAPLRETPDWHSTPLLTLPRLSRLQIRAWEGAWLHIIWLDETHSPVSGYIDTGSLITKADFAAFARTDSGAWRAVQFRDNANLVVDHGTRIPLSEVQEVITRPDLAIVAKDNVLESLPLQTHLAILQEGAGQWNVSELKGHGEVYWKTPDTQKPKLEQIPMLSTDEILQKNISAVAIATQHPKWNLVAADGVYWTEDGEHWRKTLFDEVSGGPLAIGPQRQIIINDQLSEDGGLSFHRYIRWDELAQLLELNRGHDSPNLKLQKVAFVGAHEIELSLQAGSHPMRVRGTLNGHYKVIP